MLSAGGLALLLSACGASTFLAVEPANSNGPWVNGHPTSVVSHPDSVYVRAGFLRADDNELVFEVAYLNYSDKPILIAPETFYYMAVPDTLADSTRVPTQYFAGRRLAADPEVRLVQLQARLKEQERKATNVSWFEILTTVTDLAEDVSSIKKKETDQQVAEREARHQDNQAFFDNQRLDHADQAQQLYSQTTALEAVVLRKNTLAPGQGLRGQVFFPRLDVARKLRLVVFFDERPVQFIFNQALRGTRQYQPAPAAVAQTEPR
ncbi:hypothetical protein [Hymenobacter metallilatus]|uniref:DUF4369 domain-containing protein n=1 Tax=Hymenobacter metallilatus TaxID=2493666 RepID=A0A428JH24_9BACT|nr:hypothetical protein [Hymenobacter metallilatus]RSK31684.1 hypothetical protein EI290_12700 [Hymenobacter metallilatus]